MAGISPEHYMPQPGAYQQQAHIAGQDALAQLSSSFAGRGMLSSGALQTAGAGALSRLYGDASARYQADRTAGYARYQQDRINSVAAALGGQQNVTGQYNSQINPNPYAGLGASLGAIGTAAGQYLYRPPGTPGVGTGPGPGFGVSYPYQPYRP